MKIYAFLNNFSAVMILTFSLTSIMAERPGAITVPLYNYLWLQNE